MDCEPKQTLCILNCFCLATLLEEQETTLIIDCMKNFLKYALKSQRFMKFTWRNDNYMRKQKNRNKKNDRE